MWQTCYDPDSLSDADKQKQILTRAPRAETDWQVSRAVGAALRRAGGAGRNAPLALSHSRGHALAGLATPAWALGVDLERCRPRDIEGLASWVCTPQETAMLRAQPEGARRLERFYLLWTVKEALLKAAGLSFPADMRRVGLTEESGLLAPQGQWQAMAWRLGRDWIAAVAWNSAPALSGPADVLWHEPAQPYLLGHWTQYASINTPHRKQ